ncbi:hypothetical protein TIFTF001_056320, partial [Ficus carica]
MNKNVKKFSRVTHSRYENSTASWTMFSTQDPKCRMEPTVELQRLHSAVPFCISRWRRKLAYDWPPLHPRKDAID